MKSGQLVLIYENKPIPADLVLKDSWMRDGECYIETSSLHWEKTLKFKIANKKIHRLFGERINAESSEKIEKIKNLMDFKVVGLMGN